MEGFLLMCIKPVVRQQIAKDIRGTAVCNFAAALYYSTKLYTFPLLRCIKKPACLWYDPAKPPAKTNANALWCFSSLMSIHGAAATRRTIKQSE